MIWLVFRRKKSKSFENTVLTGSGERGTKIKLPRLRREQSILKQLLLVCSRRKILVATFLFPPRFPLNQKN